MNDTVRPTPDKRFADYLKDNIPTWLKQASDETRQQLRTLGPLPSKSYPPESIVELNKAYARHQRNEKRLAPILARLPTPEAFAEPLLKAAIQARFGLELDVKAVYLVNPGRVQFTDSFLTASRDPLTAAGAQLQRVTQPLLSAALQNFEAREAAPGGMDASPRLKAEIFDRFPFGDDPAIAPIALAPEAFAGLCRELDLGGQYQALIHSLLNPPDELGQGPGVGAANRRTLFKLVEHSALEVQIHLAYLNQHIDARLRDAALQVAAQRPTMLDGQPLVCTFLTLFEVQLSGIVVIGKGRGGAAVEPVLVYIPGDPVAAFKHYASTLQFHNELRDRMLRPGYLQFFQRFVPARDRDQLLEQLNRALYPSVWNETSRYYERLANPQARLQLRETALDGRLINALYAQKIRQLSSDARFHAVPTADENDKSLRAAAEFYFGWLMQGLNLAAFVCPPLAAPMLAIAAGQLSYEIYEGVEALAHGEQAQAWQYLSDVVQNVALMTALGSAHATGGLPAMEVPEAVGNMHVVQLPDGSTRLWKPDLSPFAHDIQLPAQLQPNADGLYEYQGKKWWVQDGRRFSVKPDSSARSFSLEHPSRNNAYEPQVRHNGAGGWLHSMDNPLDWEAAQLFRRLGDLVAKVSDADAARVLQISGIDEAMLRKVMTDLESPPGLLVDSVQRLVIDQDLQRFIEQMEAGDASADPLLQRRLLEAQAQWPAEAAVPDLAGDVLEAALRSLDEPAIKHLLGEEPGIGRLAMAVRVQRLRARLAEAARSERARLFAWRYALLQGSEQAEVKLIQRDFSGLPTAVAEELVLHATEQELTQMRQTSRIPLRLAEEARAFQQQVRLARAYEGLYRDSPVDDDTATLTLHTLEQLPGWSGTVCIEVREAGLRGSLLDSIGTSTAAERKVIVRVADGYLAYDSEGMELHGLDGFHEALMHALPDSERLALGIPHVGQTSELKALLRAQPSIDRSTLRVLLKMRPLMPGEGSPMRRADGRIGYPMSGEGSMSGYITQDVLLDKLGLAGFDRVQGLDLLGRLAEGGLNRVQINARLDHMLGEHQALTAALDQWGQTLVDTVPEVWRAQARIRTTEALWQFWRGSVLAEPGPETARLTLVNLNLAEFPADLPAFIGERTFALSLPDFYYLPLDAQGGAAFNTAVERMLGHFPHVRELQFSWQFSNDSVVRPLLGALPRLLPELESLDLNGARMYILENSLDPLRSLPRLRRLDLSNNTRLGDPDFTGWHLEYLGLDNLNFSHWPAGLTAEVLTSLREVSMLGNEIRQLPAFLLDEVPDGGSVTRLRLDAQRIPQRDLLRTRLNQLLGRRFQFEFRADPQVSARLDRLEQDFRPLHQALDDWSQSSSSTTQAAPSRLDTARAIGRFWGDLLLGFKPTLVLDAASVADFPNLLPAEFHTWVERLQVTLDEQNLSAFEHLLPQFEQLTRLAVSGTGLDFNRLSTVLLRSPGLEVLDLSDLGMTIDQAVVDRLGELRSLDSLNLDGNRMGAVNNVDALLHLSELRLANTGLDAWPKWCDQFQPRVLETLDLSNNNIRELPPTQRYNPRNEWDQIQVHLRGNPLERDTLIDIQRNDGSNRSYEFWVDMPEDLRSLSRHRHDSDRAASDYESSDSEDHDPASPEQRQAQPLNLEDWLDERVDAQLLEQRRALWQQLLDSGDASDLLGLINDLRSTAEYRNPAFRSELVDQVWHVVEAAVQDPALRLNLNGMAAEPHQQFIEYDTCADGIRLAFNQMELQVYIHQALLQVSAGERGTELYRLARRLFRSQALDDIARLRAQSGQGGLARDEAEVRMAYRLRLAQELDLPVPPRRMLYEQYAEVSQGELDEVARLVREREGGQPFLDYAAQRDFWRAYLEETYAEQFSALKGAYEAQMDRLLDRLEPSESVEQAQPAIDALTADYEANRTRLLCDLTVAAGQRL